jgi:hypothetical protein
MYAKLENGYLRSAPKTIVLNGRTINNPYDSELEQLGYKQVVYTDMPADALRTTQSIQNRSCPQKKHLI